MVSAVAREMSRDQLFARLRKIAATLDRPLEARDIPQTMWRVLLSRFGSVAKARSAAGLPGPPLNHRWSEDGVLDEIRALARAGVTINHPGLKDTGREDVVGAIVTYFGSIVRARRLAGVPHPPHHYGGWSSWDDERVVAEILARHHAGEPLACSRVPGKLVAAAIRYFGGWPDAIEVAGLDYDAVRLRRRTYTDKELLDLLRDRARTHPDMRREDLAKLPFRDAVVRLFGSVDAALDRAGIEGWPRRVRERTLSARAVLEAVRARHRAGNSTRTATVQKEHHLLWFSGVVQYGTWRRVLAAARVPDVAPRAWRREEILEALRARLAKGKSLKTTTILRDGPALYAAAKKHFGGYVNAAREVDGAPWATINWTRDLVIKELRRAARAGNRVTTNRVSSALANAAGRYFGTFTAARRAAGLD